MEKKMKSAAVVENAIRGKSKDDTVVLKVSDVENILHTEEKEPRLMTIQEVMESPICTIVWEEIYDEAEKQIGGQVISLVPHVSKGDGNLVDICAGETVFVNKDFCDVSRDINGLIYKKRFWNGKPTIEQCKATPWEETPVHQDDWSYV